jgi:hypothetical protein
MIPILSRRRLLTAAAAGLVGQMLPGPALAQTAVQPPPKRSAKDEHSVTAPVSIEVNARPLNGFDTRDRARMRFGELEFRSGLMLTSGFRGFGGLSGLRLDAKGERFIAISDKGGWFTGRIAYRGKAMTGLEEVEASPLLWSDGKPITSRGWFDSESIALDGALVYVGLERVNRILRYDFSKGFTRALGEEVPLPPPARKLPYNKGLEALVAVPKGQPLAGTLIAISERALDAQGNILGFLIGGRTPGPFAVRRNEDFDVSDATLTPSGDMLLLERKFSWIGGVGIRIRHIAQKSIAPGSIIDGPAIFSADLGYEIDNMEAIDAHVGSGGETVITMISDDNFSMVQRNLLLQFTLVE